MRRLSSTRAGLGCAAIALAAGAAALAAPAAAGGGDTAPQVHLVQIEDDCHARSFNREVGPDTCVGDGQTRFAEAITQLREDGAAGKWRFAPDRFTTARGDSLRVRGTGGEFHTFTQVARFGGGCVPLLNRILGLRPVAECSDLMRLPDGSRVPRGFVETGVAPGGRLAVRDLRLGVHRFQCLIHPWMHSTVTVERR
jgi:plastocyanin